MTCKTCNGTGGITSTINGAPHGAGYWSMDYEEPCPDCVEKEICPKCDSKMIYDEDTATDRCQVCGYDESTGEVDITKENKEKEF
jgi:hypothetical protein